MDNIEKFAQLTAARDWKGISELSGGTGDSFGTKKEYRVVHEHLEPNEVVLGFASGMMTQTGTSNSSDWGTNTWLVVLTTERFLFLDHALLTSSVDKQSIRLDRVQAVSSSQGWILGKIMVDLGARVVTIDNCQKKDVALIADLANKRLREIEQRGETSASNSSSPKVDDGLATLEKLGSLRASGVLTEEEFQEKKKKILDRL